MQTFATATPITVALNIPAGRVHLVAADRTDTTVQILPANPAKSRDVKMAEQATVSYHDGVLRIEATAKNQILGASGSLEVTVQVPAGSAVTAKAASAEFRAVGQFGDITYDGAHGAITLDEAAAVRVTTHAGDITVGRVTGPAEISTAKGDIRIADAVRGTIALRTQAGDISIDAAHGISATLNAATTYGRIHNTLQNTTANTDLTIHATTAYGNITANSR